MPSDKCCLPSLPRSEARRLGRFLLHSVLVLVWLNVSVICGSALAMGFVWPLLARRGWPGPAVGLALGVALFVFAMAAALSLAPLVRRVARAGAGTGGK